MRNFYEIVSVIIFDLLCGISIVFGNEDAALLSYFIFNASDAESLFNSLISALIPTLFVISFFISGVALKTFTSCLRKISDKDSRIFTWEFSTNSFLAYFYIILAIVNLFTGSSDSTFAFVVSSLSMILMFVYAYLGMKFINSFLREKIGKTPSLIVIGIALLVFSSFALTLLSYIGVYYTITINKIFKNNSANL